MKKQYDVIILGGGMVGLALAALLKDLNISIAIIEEHAPTLYENSNYDLRVSAINAASIDLFIQCGVWKNIIEDRVSEYKRMFVWSNNAELLFSAEEAGLSELGYIIENRVIRQHLWAAVAEQKNVDLSCPVKIKSVNIEAENAVIMTSDNATIKTTLLIGADGANSWLREQLKFSLHSSDYSHHALVTTLHIENPHEKTAWQHFLSEGPLAFLPLDDENHVSIVWSLPPESATELKSCDVLLFNQKIAEAMDHKFGKVESIAPRITFPLTRQQLENYVGEHVAFVGDAAHRVHPMAGQGVNLGFQGAKNLAKSIAEAVEKKRSLSDLKILRHYQRAQKTLATQMLLMIDGLNKVFATENMILSQTRDWGMRGLNALPWLKKLFIKSANGI
jgi:2-octaprenylphenol hydroxylase